MIKVQGQLILPPRMDCVGAEIKLYLTMWHVIPRSDAMHIYMSILDFVSSYNQAGYPGRKGP